MAKPKPCPGSKIRSNGRGKGLGRGQGKGPIGKPKLRRLNRVLTGVKKG